MSRIAAQNNKNYAMASHPQRISPTDLSYTFPTNHLELGPTIDTFDFGRDGLRASFSSTGTGTGSESTTSEGPITPVTSTTTFDRSDLALKEYTFPQKTPVEPGRKHIRKLPPRLTESLENLALTLHISTSPSSAPTNLWELDEMYEYTVDKPLPITPKGSLEMPDRKVDQEPTRLVSQRSMPSIRGLSRRSTLKKGTARPSTAPIRHLGSRRHQHAESSASSATSNNLVTPSSSVPRASASICSEQCSRFEETNWTLYNEVHRADLDAAARKGKETRREKKERKRAEEEAFDADALPAMTNLYEAANVEIIGENGQRIAFGDLVRERTTIVIFIRHWFCPLCAQYMDSILSQVRPGALEEADVGLIIIGNGSGKMLPAYKNKAFKCPFPMYTDPSLQLYRALGLTRQTGDAGPDEDAGDYLVQTGFQSTLSTLKSATLMPLKNPGHFFQLGGEFVFDGTLNCTYAHRMTTTRDHAPIRDVCHEAGVRLEWVHYEPGEGPPPVHRGSFASALDLWVQDGSDVSAAQTHGQEERAVTASPDLQWKADRNEEMRRMRKLKKARRSGVYIKDVKVVGSDDVDEVEGRLVGLGL